MNKKFILLFLIIASAILCNSKKNNHIENSHYVIVLLEAKQGKEAKLKEELLKVQKLSLKENTCIDYQVHEDLNNQARFVLYEIWTSKEDHSKQFQKSYIIEFGNKIENLLNKPYHFVMAKIIK